MRHHSQSQLLPLLVLLLVGVFLLTQPTKLAPWLFYCLMLAVLAGTRQLAPHWFAEKWFDYFWRGAVAVAAGGLLLEAGSQLLT